jgi:hypothetical protein
MKCPACNQSQRAKEGLRCTRCRYAYIFDPKADRMNDYRWTQIMKKASANGSVCFTKRQLHTQWALKMSPGRGGRIVGGVVLSFVTVPLAIAGGPLLLLLAAPLAVFASAIPTPKVKWERDTFRTQFDKWTAKGGRTDGLIQRPALTEPPPSWQEPDIYDYGVERIIVVEHDLLVDLLVKNNFHLEQRALIVSASGYPTYLQPQLDKVLAERPDTPVLVLRDATFRGDTVAATVEKRLRRRVLDVGLTAADVKASPMLRRLLEREADGLPLDVLPWTAFIGAIAPAIQRATTLRDLSASTSGGDSGSFFFVGGDDDFG